MSNTVKGIFFFKLPQKMDALQWVHLIPSNEEGIVKGRDGRRWVFKNPELVISYFREMNKFIPIDIDHATEKPRLNGLPVPAYGWIKDLEIRADGIWGLVEWSDDMLKLIKQRKYRYISPVLLYDEPQREIMGIDSAGVTHFPNLHLKAFAHEDKDAAMKELLERIAEALGMDPDIEEEGVLKAIEALRTAPPDPERYVPIDQVKAMMQEHGQKTQEISLEKANNKVEKAIHDGYFTPAMREWGRDLCKQNPAAFDKFINSSLPVYAHLFEPSKLEGKELNSQSKTLDGYASEVNRQLGIKS